MLVACINQLTGLYDKTIDFQNPKKRWKTF